MEARECFAATFPYLNAESVICGHLVAILLVRIPDALPWRLSSRGRKAGLRARQKPADPWRRN